MSSPDEVSRIREENFERAVSAVKRDDVDALKDVLEVLPEFNTMRTQCGNNLLHLSCWFKNKKVFDYLLNLNCFDLEAVDSNNHTTLVKTMNYNCDYFSVKLIKTGADVFKICPHDKTYLHQAMSCYLFETGKLLLLKGVDPNAQDYKGRTALHSMLEFYSNPKVDENVSLLLEYGADTAILDNNGYLPFDFAVTNGKELHIQEHLFYCTFDSHSVDYEMPSDVFNELLDAPNCRNVSPLFENVMDVVSDVILPECFPLNFFAMPPDLLKKFIERYDYIIRKAFSIITPDDNIKMNINSIEILLNSELYFETVELIGRLKLWKIYSDHHCIPRKEKSSLILYLLSYGLNVTSLDCHKIYRIEGYSDLFRTILLHLNYTDTSQIGLSMRIIVDIHFDVNTFLARFHCFLCNEIEPLLDHFANSALRLFCERSHEPDLVNKVRQLPTVPSLLQLARDETRRHIVRRYNLQKTSQYYWVLRKLEVGTTYEEILSFETKLYG